MEHRRKFVAALFAGCSVAFPAFSACPSVDASIRSAESDLVSFFLADAQTSLGQAVDGMACTKPVPAELRARYWQAQAMIWRLQGDGRAEAGFAASRRIEDSEFHAEYGSDAREIWASAVPSTDATVSLSVRGRGDQETLWIDGELNDGNVAPGYHLLQVGEDEPRAALAVNIPAGTSFEVAVPRIAAPAPVAEPEPVVESAPVGEPAPASVPKPGPVAGPELAAEPEPPKPEPTTAPEPAAPEPIVEPKPEPAPEPVSTTGSTAFVPPLSGRRRRLFDERGQALSWRADVKPLARQTDAGRRAIRARPRNSIAQLVTLGTFAGGAYLGYLGGWQALRSNKNFVPGIIVAGSGAIVSITSLGLRSSLSAKRKQHTETIRGEAQSVLERE